MFGHRNALRDDVAGGDSGTQTKYTPVRFAWRLPIVTMPSDTAALDRNSGDSAMGVVELAVHSFS